MKIGILSVEDGCINNSISNFFEVSDNVFNYKFCYNAIKQVIEALLKNSKICYKGGKTRSMVRGGGRKPWKQKGTGKARAGSIRSPIWRGGGRTFVPLSYYVKKKNKINKKVKKCVLKSVFSELIRQNRFFIFPEFDFDIYNFKAFKKIFCNFLFHKKLIILIESKNLYLKKSSDNFSNIILMTREELDILKIINSDLVISTLTCVKNLEKCLL